MRQTIHNSNGSEGLVGDFIGLLEGVTSIRIRPIDDLGRTNTQKHPALIIDFSMLGFIQTPVDQKGV